MICFFFVLFTVGMLLLMLLLHENCLYLCSCSYMDEGERRGGEGTKTTQANHRRPKWHRHNVQAFPLQLNRTSGVQKAGSSIILPFFPTGLL